MAALNPVFMSVDCNSLGIFLDRHGHSPGEVVDGVLCLNVVTPLETAGIFLKLSGSTSCSWNKAYTVKTETFQTTTDWTGASKTEPKTKTEVHYDAMKGERNILDMTVNVAGPGLYSPGQYQWPFVLPLPANLPPSLKVAAVGGTKVDCKASVKYALEATCYMGSHLQGTAGYDRMAAATDLYIVPPLQTQPLRTESNEVVSTCWCFASKQATASLEVDQVDAAAGGVLRVTVTVQESAGRPFTKIEAKVKQQIKVAANCPGSHYSEALTDASQGMGAIAIYGEGDFKETVGKCTVLGFTKENPTGVKMFEVHLPQGTWASIMDDIVMTRSWLEVTCKTGAMATNLHMTVPLLMRAGQVDMPQPLLQWAPVAASMAWRPVQACATPLALRIPGSPQVPQQMMGNDGHFWSPWLKPGTPVLWLPPPPAPGCQPPDGTPTPVFGGSPSMGQAPLPYGPGQPMPYPAPMGPGGMPGSGKLPAVSPGAYMPPGLSGGSSPTAPQTPPFGAPAMGSVGVV